MQDMKKSTRPLGARDAGAEPLHAKHSRVTPAAHRDARYTPTVTVTDAVRQRQGRPRPRLHTNITRRKPAHIPQSSGSSCEPGCACADRTCSLPDSRVSVCWQRATLLSLRYVPRGGVNGRPRSDARITGFR
jgi:hypothetical protein